MNQENRIRRGRVQAKKAIAELEPTRGMTMRSDAIGAMQFAMEELEAFLDDEDLGRLQEAHDYLQVNIAGTVGSSLHAESHFQNAIAELEKVEGVEADEQP